MNRENCLLIIAGPSAVGKTTIAYSLIEREPKFEFVRSVTTRKSRGDSYDNEYIYISIPEFLELIENGGVLEHTEYAGNYYGTPRAEVKRILSEGKIPLLVLDINGVGSLVKNAEDLSPCGVYVYDDLSVIEKRLHERFIGLNPTDEGTRKYEGRVRQNIADFKTIPENTDRFFAFVHNKGTVEQTAEEVFDVFQGFCKGEGRDGAAVDFTAHELCDSVAKAQSL